MECVAGPRNLHLDRAHSAIGMRLGRHAGELHQCRLVRFSKSHTVSIMLANKSGSVRNIAHRAIISLQFGQARPRRGQTDVPGTARYRSAPIPPFVRNRAAALPNRGSGTPGGLDLVGAADRKRLTETRQHATDAARARTGRRSKHSSARASPLSANRPPSSATSCYTASRPARRAFINGHSIGWYVSSTSFAR